MNYKSFIITIIIAIYSSCSASKVVTIEQSTEQQQQRITIDTNSNLTIQYK